MHYKTENLKTKKYSGGKARVHTHRIFYGPRRTSERNGVDYKREEKY